MSGLAFDGEGAVHEAREEDLPAAGDALAAAFAEDPFFLFLFPDQARRAKRLRGSFDVYLDTWRGRGSTFVAGAGGAAIWAPPDGWRLPVGPSLHGGARLLPMIGVRRVPGALQAWRMVEKRHPERPPHWYLFMLGVRPERQGEGVGSALVRPVLERCDAEGLPAYVETANEVNLPFYRRHGWEVCDELDVPRGPRVWCMWREPPREG